MDAHRRGDYDSAKVTRQRRRRIRGNRRGWSRAYKGPTEARIGTLNASVQVAVAGCVHGRVQGVAFRHSMQQMAAGLGLVGWVRNLPDRSVAFHAEGLEGAVDALLRWSQSGPALARVDTVDVETCDVHRFESFEILP